MKLHFSLLAFLLVGVFILGCSKDSPDATSADSPADKGEIAADFSSEEDIIRLAVETFEGGRTNAAITMLESELAKKDADSDKSSLFCALVRMLVDAEKMEDAQAKILTAFASNPRLANSSVGIVYSALAANEDLEDELAWTERVLSLGDKLPAEIRRTFKDWNLFANLRCGNNEKAVRLATEALEENFSLAKNFVDALFAEKKFDLVEKLLAGAASTPGSAKFLAATRIRLDGALGKWDAVTAALPAAIAKFDDALLCTLVRQLSAMNKKAGIAELVIAEQTGKSAATLKRSTLSFAARTQLTETIAADKTQLPAFLTSLMATPLPSDAIADYFTGYFYDVSDSAEVLAEMRDIGNRLLPLTATERTRGSLRSILLDAAFLADDFDAAIELLEGGIPEKSEAWHKMALTKLKAHKAERAGNWADAAKLYREFMTIMATANEEDLENVDPQTGVEYSLNFILAFNAKRIGHLYEKVGDKAASEAAFAEAKALFEKALSAADDVELKKIIENEMK